MRPKERHHRLECLKTLGKRVSLSRLTSGGSTRIDRRSDCRRKHADALFGLEPSDVFFDDVVGGGVVVVVVVAPRRPLILLSRVDLSNGVRFVFFLLFSSAPPVELRVGRWAKKKKRDDDDDDVSLVLFGTSRRPPVVALKVFYSRAEKK